MVDKAAFRRTKIIATLGPATRSLAKITSLLETGVNLVRLNMSHGDHDSHRRLVSHVRRAAKKLNCHTAIIMDLCGPKIRVGRFREGSIALEEGAEVEITVRQVIGDKGLISSQYRRLHKDVRKGERILLDDGNMELQVDRVRKTSVFCKVIHGGMLKDNKGMNLPDSNVSISSFTDKDRRDAELAIELGADYLALSFVRNADDVLALSRFLKRHNADIPIISKIEKPEAVAQIESILQHSNAIMVARGDLGIELPAETVPLVQRELICKARLHDRPVIVATQMLDSMIERSRPTRAEVGDVANAALSGVDAVMLSGETASGANPLLAVRTMDTIIREMEAHQLLKGVFGATGYEDEINDPDPIRGALSQAASVIARKIQIDAMIIPTRTGTTARVLCSERPLAPEIGVGHDPAICRQMSLYWGVVPIHIPETGLHDWRKLCELISQQSDLTRAGRTVLIVSGFHEEAAQNEPVLKVLQL